MSFRKGGGKLDDFVEFRLVESWIPVDKVLASDGVVKWDGGWLEDGASAVRWEEVEVLVDVVWGRIIVGVDVGGLWAPDLRGDVD